MRSEPGQALEALDHFGLDSHSLEELKEKAIAAKGRAYCRCCLSTWSNFVLHGVCINSNVFRPSRSEISLFREYVTLLRWKDFIFWPLMSRMQTRKCPSKVLFLLDFLGFRAPLVTVFRFDLLIDIFMYLFLCTQRKIYC